MKNKKQTRPRGLKTFRSGKEKSDKGTMARNETMIRIFKVLHFLETSKAGLSVQQIQEKLEPDGIKVHEKTIKRDLECIQSAHFDLEKFNTVEGVKYKVKPLTQVSKNIVFTYKEIMAHYLARKYLAHLKGSPLYEALDQFFTKLEKLFGTNCEAFNEFESNMEFKAKMTWHNSVSSEVLDTVYHALEEGHCLKFEYKAQAGAKAGEFAIRQVGPECLYFADAGVYLIGKDMAKNEPRTYALARMKNVVDDPESPYDKEGLAPADLFKDSFGVLNNGEVEDVEILLQGPVAQYIVERRWHHSQKVIKRDDGSHLNLRVKVNDELVRWVLGLGDGATVLRPESLKNSVTSMIKKVLSRYSKDKAA